VYYFVTRGLDRRTDYDGSPMLDAHSVMCPYCGEQFETVLDASGGSQVYIEDCQACCRPIEFHMEVDENGTVISLQTRRDDE